jgi:small subunit ribosomal protein S6
VRVYELVFIVHPELDDTALKEMVERVRSWITDFGGQVNKIDLWGKRRLAYPLQQQKEGQYVFMNLSLAPTRCNELERNLRYQEPILRYLLTVEE